MFSKLEKHLRNKWWPDVIKIAIVCFVMAT